MGPEVQPKCFRHEKHMRNNWELRKWGYLIRFGHTEALLVKKKDIKRPFFPPCRNWPICVISTIYNMYLTSLCSNMYLYNMCTWHWPFQRRSPSKTENASCRVGQNAPHVKKDEVATKCHMGPILRKQFAQCNLFCLACETEDIINATSDQW